MKKYIINENQLNNILSILGELKAKDTFHLITELYSLETEEQLISKLDNKVNCRNQEDAFNSQCNVES